MCCNGVLFDLVRLQPADSVRGLEALGMKVRRKKKEPYFSQPCTSLQDCSCSIYAHRPQRCQMFECITLRRALRREISDQEALQTIDEIKTRVAAVEQCLRQDSADDIRLPLKERYFQGLLRLAPESAQKKQWVAVFELLQAAIHQYLRADEVSETPASIRCAPNTVDEEMLRQHGSA